MGLAGIVVVFATGAPGAAETASRGWPASARGGRNGCAALDIGEGTAGSSVAVLTVSIVAVKTTSGSAWTIPAADAADTA